MKNRRYDAVCECCKTPIELGERVAIFAGRPWLPAHLIAYRQRRNQMRMK